MLSTVALLVALSGGPDYAAVAQRPVSAPTSAPPAAPAAPLPPSQADADIAVVAEAVASAEDPRLAPALDWFVWDQLADCESGGRWDAQGSRYGGGLQILTATWRAFGGTEFADLPGQATREQQIAVGRAIVDAGGWGQWPSCARRLGLK